MGAIAIEPEEDICRVLDKLFRMYISYKPQQKKYDNQIEECKRKVKSLSSMAFYSERRLAANEKDILCVVMLAPSIKANQYDLAQIDNYIYQLEKDNTIVKEGVRFRIYFVVSICWQILQNHRWLLLLTTKNHFSINVVI